MEFFISISGGGPDPLDLPHKYVTGCAHALSMVLSSKDGKTTLSTSF